MNDPLERVRQLWRRRTGEHTPLHAAPFSGAVPRTSFGKRLGVLVGSTAVLTLAAPASAGAWPRRRRRCPRTMRQRRPPTTAPARSAGYSW